MSLTQFLSKFLDYFLIKYQFDHPRTKHYLSNNLFVSLILIHVHYLIEFIPLYSLLFLFIICMLEIIIFYHFFILYILSVFLQLYYQKSENRILNYLVLFLIKYYDQLLLHPHQLFFHEIKKTFALKHLVFLSILLLE